MEDDKSSIYHWRSVCLLTLITFASPPTCLPEHNLEDEESQTSIRRIIQLCTSMPNNTSTDCLPSVRFHVQLLMMLLSTRDFDKMLLDFHLLLPNFTVKMKFHNSLTCLLVHPISWQFVFALDKVCQACNLRQSSVTSRNFDCSFYNPSNRPLIKHLNSKQTEASKLSPPQLWVRADLLGDENLMFFNLIFVFSIFLFLFFFRRDRRRRAEAVSIILYDIRNWFRGLVKKRREFFSKSAH